MHADYVWKNIENDLWRMPDADELYSVNWDAWQHNEECWRLVANVLTVMRNAAFGRHPVYDTDPNPIFRRIQVNPDCYALTIRQNKRHLLDLSRSTTTKRIVDFGPIIGFSAVNPLTPEGYESYLKSEYPLTSVPLEHIVSWPYRRNTVRHLFITGAVFLPEIDLPGEMEIHGRVSFNGKQVLLELGRQIAGFIPELQICLDGAIPFAAVATKGADKLPLIVCPLSGRFKGEQFICDLGFTKHEFQDPENFTLWVCDPSKIGVLTPQEQKNMGKFFNALRQLNG